MNHRRFFFTALVATLCAADLSAGMLLHRKRHHRPLMRDLVAYWKLDEASGDRADTYVNGLTLTDNNTVGSNDGNYNGTVGIAADLELTNTEYFTHADNDLFDFPGSFTISGWFNFESLSATAFMTTKYLTSGNNRSFWTVYSNTPDRFSMRIYTDGTSGANTSVFADNFGSPSTGVWYFIVAYCDASDLVVGISVNAGTADEESVTSCAYQGTSDLRIGVRETSFPVDGRIQALSIHNRRLTDTEQALLFNNNKVKRWPW